MIENESVDTSKVDADFFNHFSERVTLEHALNNTIDSQIMGIFNVSQSIENLLKKYSDHMEAFRNQCFIDMVPKYYSKGNAIMRILEDENNGTDNLYAVGDSLNDVSMFNITKNNYTFNETEEIVKPHSDNIIDYVYEVVEDILR